MSFNQPIQLGLCCMNITLRERKPSIYASRRINQKTIREKGIDECKRRVLENLEDTIKMIEWNEQNGIKVMRLSSDIFPHKANPDVEDYTFDFAKDLLKRAGDLAKKYNQRITMHPGQYNVVGTPNENVFVKTILDLDYQAELLDLMGMGKNSVMVVHGGGVYGDKKATMKRWCDNYYRLPQRVRNRLVLENCEKCFNIEDCLEISRVIGIPVVFDTHHFECYKYYHPEVKLKDPEFYMGDIIKSWRRRGIKPKFHISEQGTSKRIGHHSDYIEVIPNYLKEIPEKYGIDIDIMIEAKKKELAIQKLYKKYPELDCKNNESLLVKVKIKVI